jgi:hypothetical protein
MSDPQPEPTVLFYDIWRPAGIGQTPIPTGDHFVVELRRAGALSLRGGAFYSRLHGVGEVRPVVADTGESGFFRFGSGRNWGLDAELSASGRRASARLTYVLSWAQRRWDGSGGIETVPWVHDRRHQMRVFAGISAGKGWRVNALVEVSSPEPLTPALGIFSVGLLSPGGGGILRDTTTGTPVIAAGKENSARGDWVGHLDLAIEKRIALSTRISGAVGLSALNVLFTRVARVKPVIEPVFVPPFTTLWRLGFRPAFILPPIPTVTFKLEF